jgi:type II secretory pathway component GspD/PulD (secretin)
VLVGKLLRIAAKWVALEYSCESCPRLSHHVFILPQLPFTAVPQATSAEGTTMSRSPFAFLFAAIVLGVIVVASPPVKAAAEKRFLFEMRGTSWNKVLEWLADQSGLAVSTDLKPTGTFTFITPKGRKNGYTLPEIIDLLNEALASQKYLLIRRSQSFAVIATDQPIDASLLPGIKPEELDNRGNTELVQTTLPLKSVLATDAAREVKEMLGPFGKVTPLALANQLLVQDTAGNIKRLRSLVHDMEEQAAARSCKYICINVDAAAAVEMLKLLLPAPGGTTHKIAVDERVNGVLVTGAADQIALAQRLLKAMDAQTEDDTGTRRLIRLKIGSASAVAEELQAILKQAFPQHPVKVIAPGKGMDGRPK